MGRHNAGHTSLTGFLERYKIYTTMGFEFDKKKSAANKAKHGIDFFEARALWDDPDVIEIPARTEDEPRSLAIGRIGGACWSAVFTHRGAEIRIISVRRSRQTEVDTYEGQGV